MASLSLKSIKKIYPHSGDQGKAKKKRGSELPGAEKKVNLHTKFQ